MLLGHLSFFVDMCCMSIHPSTNSSIKPDACSIWNRNFC